MRLALRPKSRGQSELRLAARTRLTHGSIAILLLSFGASVICMSALVSHEALTGVALLLSLLLLTFLMFHTVEHADSRPRVPLPQRADTITEAVAQLVDSDMPVSGEQGEMPVRVPPPPAALLLHPSPLASAHEFCAAVLLVFGLWYCGWMFAHGVLVLRHPSGYAHVAASASAAAAAAGSSLESCGVSRVVFVIFVTAGGENGGMFLGKLLGRSKFTPRISPNKSREGALAQVVTSALVAVACAARMDVDIPIGACHAKTESGAATLAPSEDAAAGTGCAR